MSFRSFSPFLFLAFAAAVARAVDSDVDSAGSDQLILDPIVTTASPLAREADEIAQPTSVVGGHLLDERRQATLGETLSGQPGVDSTYFGPGASRPVIRGLGGDRIRVLAGGIGTIDASVISPDHAVSLDPLLVERVEIVRGPATLLYGGGAIGGVVNVIDGRIPETLPAAPVTGRFEARGATAAHELAGAGVLEGAVGRWAWRLDGFRRETDDVRIPGLGPTPEKAAEMIAEGETPSNGTLVNSATDTSGGSAGLSYIGPAGHLGVSYNGFDSFYGIVAEPDVRIDLRQRRWDLHGEWLQPAGVLRAIKLQLGFGDYRHDELEGEEVGTRFTNEGHEGRLEFLHEKIGPFEGALGFQSTRSDFAALGDEAFLPPSVTTGNAVFLYEEAATGAVTWQLGARWERQKIAPDAGSGHGEVSHPLSTFTGGAVWTLSPDYALALSVSANERAPNAQELFADGPHVGTGTYEVGDMGLRPEKSIGVDLSLRRTAGFVTGELNFFVNRFDGYIYEQDTGAVDDESGLPVFAYVQRDAQFYGGELEVTFHLQKGKDRATDLRFFADSVRATNTTDNTPLPRTTPVRFGVGLDWHAGPWSFTTELRHVGDQDRVAPGETPTDGYELLSVAFSRHIDIGRGHAELFLRGTNLLDETARVHASFLKDIAPLPGRDVSVGIRYLF
jgi:iron complex outermembrane receptor protein